MIANPRNCGYFIASSGNSQPSGAGGNRCHLAVNEVINRANINEVTFVLGHESNHTYI